ncbi:hypothetical protein GOBAR_DD17442 [Gossypium barbadense]|nr:hypothetical protein GOBAR_DD17442 [Gossypium barbadense]
MVLIDSSPQDASLVLVADGSRSTMVNKDGAATFLSTKKIALLVDESNYLAWRQHVYSSSKLIAYNYISKKSTTDSKHQSNSSSVYYTESSGSDRSDSVSQVLSDAIPLVAAQNVHAMRTRGKAEYSIVFCIDLSLIFKFPKSAQVVSPHMDKEQRLGHEESKAFREIELTLLAFGCVLEQFCFLIKAQNMSLMVFKKTKMSVELLHAKGRRRRLFPTRSRTMIYSGRCGLPLGLRQSQNRRRKGQASYLSCK